MHPQSDLLEQVKLLLDTVLSLNGRSAQFTSDTLLLGAIPEFDSFAAAALLAALEDRFGIVFDDDEINAEAFATVGTLTNLVAAHLGVV